MSDLSDLRGIYPTSLRWNAETGFLAISVFNAETGERELQEIELGPLATFALDLATRERGYGLIKIGLYDMQLTPVGSPPPPWPEDEEYKPALGCWMWGPKFGELRLETNATIFRQAVTNVWDRARLEPQAADGLQPVVRFSDRIRIQFKSIGKSFFGPVIKTIGWIERDKVPGWREREPSVPPPAALPVLPAPSAAPTTPAAPSAPAKEPAKASQDKAKRLATNPPDDPLDDEIPFER
jgi:hypothetical protein